MTKELKSFESRVKKLPADYQAAWEKINANLWPLIKDSKTYADIYQESVDQEGNKSMKKVTDKKSKKGISPL
jgi:DNA-binding ferritin-like protein (Dps family)